MSNHSKRLQGASVSPIQESEIQEIRPFILALQQEGWVANIDYEVDYTDASPYSKPWLYRIECSKKFSLEVYKRPHSRGLFKPRFVYSVEIADAHEQELVLLGYVADKSHLEALRKGLRVYLKQLDGYPTEADALFATSPTQSVLMGR